MSIAADRTRQSGDQDGPRADRDAAQPDKPSSPEAAAPLTAPGRLAWGGAGPPLPYQTTVRALRGLNHLHGNAYVQRLMVRSLASRAEVMRSEGGPCQACQDHPEAPCADCAARAEGSGAVDIMRSASDAPCQACQEHPEAPCAD